jgi:predicted small metal-binding protein
VPYSGANQERIEPVYRYVCENIIPGCTYTAEAETREKLMEKVSVHLRERHDLNHRDERIAKTLRESGIFYVRQA